MMEYETSLQQLSIEKLVAWGYTCYCVRCYHVHKELRRTCPRCRKPMADLKHGRLVRDRSLPFAPPKTRDLDRRPGGMHYGSRTPAEVAA